MDQLHEITAKAVTDETLPAGLEIRNGIFPPITVQDWYKGDPKTGIIAFFGDQAVGFIPMIVKDIKITPQKTVTAAFEHAVGTLEAHRGKGIGSTMIEAAGLALKGEVDTLFVYRGAERSKGYRFYEKTGHVDLLYTRIHDCDAAVGRQHQQVEVSYGTREIIRHQDRLLEIFDDTYYGYAGFPARHNEYWEKALQSVFFVSRPADFYFFTLRENGKMTAYLIATKHKTPMRKNATNKLEIMELAASGASESKMRMVLETACAFSETLGMDGLSIKSGDEHPFLPLLHSLGFEAKPRSMQVMSHSFDSPAVFEKLWQDQFDLPGVELSAWTPKQDFILVESKREPAETRKVTLEMKEHTLIQWLMGRIDFKARINEGTITVHNGNETIVDEITKALPYRKWEYHPLDYC